jgi:peroxiredoxin
MCSTRRCAQLGLVAAAFVLFTAMATLLLVPRYSRPVAAADVGTAAPDFQLNDRQGHSITFSKERGHAVVLFFAPADPIQSSTYSGRIETLARRYAADQRVKFFAFNVPSDDQIALPAFDAQTDATVPTLIDSKGVVATRYSAPPQAPLFVVIDPAGIVRYRGPFDDHIDLAFASRFYCAEALGEVLGSPIGAFVSSKLDH